MSMFDLILGSTEEELQNSRNHPFTYKKRRKTANLMYSKKSTTVLFKEEDRNRTCYCRLKNYRIMNDVFRNKR
jgi:hypothetical protein